MQNLMIMNRLVYLLFLIPIVYSCSDSLDNISSGDRFETINGFEVEWRSQITSQQKDAIRDILNNMILVEGGYFTMGATPEQAEFARDNEYPNIYIKLSDYYINRYEVSDEQFNIITGLNKQSSERYASCMTLSDWRWFMSILSDLCSIRFSLPTEAQWEYAARGGKQTRNYIYPGSNELSQVHSSSHLSGSKIPNELGLYNMADLKSEWCEDMYANLEVIGLEINRLNKEGKYHVVRGGNYLCNKETAKYYPDNSSTIAYSINYGNTYLDRELDYRHCRVTSRSYAHDNGIGHDNVGCRLVINISTTNK